MIRWIRLLALVCLILCVHCKMIDLDCALTNPVHCQTLLEGNDNTFGTAEVDTLVWDEPVVTLAVTATVPAVSAAPPPCPLFLAVPLAAAPADPQRAKRPPPFLT